MNPVAAPGAIPVVPQNVLVGIPQMGAHTIISGATPVVIPPSVPTVAEPAGPPNNTVYVNNLNEKIKKDELKKSLYAVFVQFGQILDIITGKSVKMRGQAFVVFDEINSATTALRAMQGFPLYEKPMRIQFAKIDSDVIAKRKGTFVERPKASSKAAAAAAAEAAAAAAAAAAIEAVGPQGGTSARAIRRRQQRAAAAAAAAAAASGAAVPPPPTTENHNGAPPAPAAPPPINPATIPDQPPNKILFLTNLPEDSDEAMLSMLFNQFKGYHEVRMVPGRHDIAFVEFDSEFEAGEAKHGLQGFNIRPGRPIRITFAKK
ncbi:unnamed protein product [Calicophoron daubneyi]|uniref:RRM domain-containing protein n=1 Tax=Calicophoron daubneyi TaxID=300641 RepID=A0AAV2TGI7_CALDB